MKTLTVTEARQKLGSWLTRALKGEDVGVLWEGQVVALRPVKVYSEDYALIEYGLTADEVDRAYQKTLRETRAQKKQGKLKKFV
jgi:antitoxin (DNA-binding transcriptional repressor) of toxin-antitoxin stability system